MNVPLPLEMGEDALTLTQVTGTGAEGCHGVPEKVGGMDATQFKLSPFEGYLLSLVDGATVVDDVVAASGLSPVDAAQAFKRLKQLGILRFRTEPNSRAAELASTSGPRLAPTPQGAARPESPAVDLLIKASRAARDLGDLAHARDLAVQACRMAPSNREAAQVRMELEDPSFAPQRAALLEALGQREEQNLHLVDASAFYHRALQEYEPLPAVHYRLAICILRSGLDMDDAIRHLRRALELQPDNPNVVRVLTRLKELKP